MDGSLEIAGESLTEGADDYLEALFRIEPHPEAECQVLDVGCRSDCVRQNLVSRAGDVGQTCRAEVTNDDGDRRLLEKPVCGRCICPLFSRHDCITTIESVADDQLVVSFLVPNRDELVDIVSSLREIGATPRLQQISGSNDDSSDRSIELEVDSLTDKQREAVSSAVELGYYETPRRANLGDLAERLEVSRSAVSQRLTAVEAKLIEELFEVDNGSPVQR